MEHSLKIKEPGWLALRIAAKNAKNEFDRMLFGHTSAVYVNVAGNTIFKKDAAEGLLEEMKNDIKTIEEKALFQLRVYALLYWKNNGVLPRLLQLIYLGDGKLVKSNPTMAELEATEKVLRRVAKDIFISIEKE